MFRYCCGNIDVLFLSGEENVAAKISVEIEFFSRFVILDLPSLLCLLVLHVISC